MGTTITTDNEYRNLVDNIRLASVVPPRVTGVENRVHELTAMDKAVKLHYIRGLYIFKKEAVQDLDIFLLKQPLYKCLNLYYPVSGRICRREVDNDEGGGGELFIKCNDSGIRTVEANCRLTVDEWLLLAENHQSINDQLVYRQVLGPDLQFSPLVYVQFTLFKCGGLSIGLSWAHILGDLFSASEFIQYWASGKFHPPKISPSPPPVIPIAGKSVPFSPKTIAPFGDNWLTPTISQMGTHTFVFTPEQISALHPRVPKNNNDPTTSVKVRPFHVVAAFMWKRLSNLRTDIDEEKRIAIVVSEEKLHRGENYQLLSNSHLMMGTVEADFCVAESDLGRLVKLIVGNEVTKGIQGDDSDSDFVVYGGGCLTFVDAEDMDLYGLELNGEKPVFANYTVDGVGDFGAVLVLPGSGGSEGRAVTVIVPVDWIEDLKKDVNNEMKAFSSC